MKTKEQIKELKDKIAADAAARKERVDEFYSEAQARRLENEARLGDIERTHTVTLGIDMGVVWLPTGHMIVVRRPELLPYDQYQAKGNVAIVKGKSEEMAKLQDDLLDSGVLLYPTKGELELLCDTCADAKGEAVNLASHMHDIESKVFEGKS